MSGEICVWKLVARNISGTTFLDREEDSSYQCPSCEGTLEAKTHLRCGRAVFRNQTSFQKNNITYQS